MKIGIVSDSHGKSQTLKDAIYELLASGAQAIVHCGDIESPADAKYLASLKVPAYLAAGNCDRPYLAQYHKIASETNLNFAEDFVSVPIGEGQFLVASHGHRQHLVQELIEGGQFPFVCLGHSHIRTEITKSGVTILNPGSLYNPRAKGKSVLLLDTGTSKTNFIEIG